MRPPNGAAPSGSMRIFELRLWVDNPHATFAFECDGFAASFHTLLRKEHSGSCHWQATDSLLIRHRVAQSRRPAVPPKVPWPTSDGNRRRRSSRGRSKPANPASAPVRRIQRMASMHRHSSSHFRPRRWIPLRASPWASIFLTRPSAYRSERTLLVGSQSDESGSGVVL